MKEFNQRLKQISEHYNLTSYADFAKKAGISHQNASNYLKGERVPNAEALKRIIQKFEGLNAEWLLTGEGSMIVNGMLKENSPVYEPNYNSDLEKEVSHLKQLNAELKSNNDNLRKMISMLEEKIQDLQDQNTNFQENH